MKKELTIKHEMFGDLRCPIYNVVEISGALESVTADLVELEELQTENELIYGQLDLSLVFQSIALTNIQEAYNHLKLSVCN
jgi:hypothetical protein